MTRHEAIEKIDRVLECLDTGTLQRLLADLEYYQKLSIIPSKGGRIGRYKPLPVKEGRNSEEIIREARDSRENTL